MSDKESLWQRCRQMEAQENLGESFKCALYLQRMDPNDKEVIETLRRLNEKIQKLSQEANSTENRMKKTIQYLKDETEDDDKRIGAANNLIALVRENSGRKLFIEQKGFDLLVSLLKNPKVLYDIRMGLVRVLAQIIGSSMESAQLVYSSIGIDFIIEIMSREKNDEFLIASQSAIQGMLTHFSGFSAKENQKIDKEKAKKYEQHIDTIMASLFQRINQRMMSAKCRDCLFELLMVNVDPEAIDWGKKLIKGNGLSKLLEVASELVEVRYESSMPITADTRTHVALVLEKIYNCMDCDKSREEFRTQMMQFMNDHLRGPNIESKVRATAAITALLNGPIDAGNHCLTQVGIVEMMLAMANSDDVVQQCVAAEALIAATVKKDKSETIAREGMGILKALFRSNNPKIKVRALVGLCKLGSVGGTDASTRVISDESTMELYKACCDLLEIGGKSPDHQNKPEDIRKWAAEGIAYLSLNADVKEALCKDLKSLEQLIELGKSGELSCLFGVVTTFVNITNSYEKQEIIPEMIELAKFAKQHVPEEHVLDAKQYVDARCKILAENHVTSALVALSKTQAKTSREMICRVFNAICEHVNLRGYVVQEGGVRVLIRLALENNMLTGKRLAAQAIARIAITNDPSLVFPGQRALEVVGPIMELLHPECSALQNFESLMALTNLAQMSVQLRNRIIKDGGYSSIEQFIYEDHQMLKRSSTQCIANLILADSIVKLFEGDNDRVKYFVILCGDDDLDTASAAAGALAMLTSISKKSCQKILDAKEWQQYLMQLISSKYPELQHRGVVIVHNMISSNGNCARKIIESPILEILMAITQPGIIETNDTVKEIAKASLKRAEQLKLIKHIENLNLQQETGEDVEREL